MKNQKRFDKIKNLKYLIRNTENNNCKIWKNSACYKNEFNFMNPKRFQVGFTARNR